MYLVIENTPGYLPDADEPATFESFSDGLEYAEELAAELEGQGYTCDRDTPGHIYCTTKDKMYDLGRVIEVMKVRTR